jgi:hypothetical protein
MSLKIVNGAVTVAWIAIVVVVISAFASGRGAAFSALNWRGNSASVSIANPALTSRAVQTVAAGQRVGAAPGQKGATYYSLEAQTSRLATHFVDGTIASSERAIDGMVTTKLIDRDGNELHRLRVDRVDDATSVLSYLPVGASSRLAQIDKDVHATLDWTNQQSHKLHQDRVTADTKLEWRGGLMRRAGIAPAGDADADRDVRQITTEWANGLSATTVRVRAKGGDRVAGRPVEGDVLATKIARNGLQIGLANYFVNERTFAWKIDGVPDGSIAEEHLKSRHGGWPFSPDMIWMNLQTLALYQWKTAIDQRGFVAQNGSCPSRVPALVERVANFFVPTAHANEPGCDGLHWLDGTIYRYCCDVHDFCYTKFGCSSTTWWQWWSSWTCDVCNGWTVGCFAGGGGLGPLYPCVC